MFDLYESIWEFNATVFETYMYYQNSDKKIGLMKLYDYILFDITFSLDFWRP